MGNEVYANTMEVSCKAADGKAICAMPDVCMTPPQTPATPPGVPVPYPNTGMASDCTEGSSTVMISGQQVMMKDQSYFSKSSGDEAGCAPMKGVITSTNMGKVYFNSWSMDVQVEGENVVRNLDLTTHNHASKPGQTPPWPYMDRISIAFASGACDKQILEVATHCDVDKKGKVKCPKKGNRTKASYAKQIEADDCQRAARCMLSPYKPSRCCKPQTPHHLVPKAGFFKVSVKAGRKMAGCGKYKADSAPCVCAEGGATTGTHGLLHARQRDAILTGPFKDAKTWKFSDSVDNASEAMVSVFPQCKDHDGGNSCIEQQLKKAHNDMGIDDDTDVKITNKSVGPKDISAFEEMWNALKGIASVSTR